MSSRDTTNLDKRVGIGVPSGSSDFEITIQFVCADVTRWLNAAFQSPKEGPLVRGVIEEAFKTTDLMYGEDVAMDWAGDFTIIEAYYKSTALLIRECNYNIPLVAKQMKTLIQRKDCLGIV